MKFAESYVADFAIKTLSWRLWCHVPVFLCYTGDYLTQGICSQTKLTAMEKCTPKSTQSCYNSLLSTEPLWTILIEIWIKIVVWGKFQNVIYKTSAILSQPQCVNTLWQNGHQFPDGNFKCIFLNENTYIFPLRFHWSLFPRAQLTISQHWFQKGLGASQAKSHCLNQCWLVYWRIYVSLNLNELRS